MKGKEYLKNREARMAMELEKRSKVKEIRQYLDEKSGVLVHVFEGPEPRPFKTVPTGYEY